MNILRRMLALALTLCVLTAPAAGAESFLEWLFSDEAEASPAPTVTPPVEAAAEETPSSDALSTLPALTPPAGIDIPDCKLQDDGWLRVNLKSLNRPQQLHLRLNGIYAVEGDRGFRFERGTEVTLTLEEGEIWLSSGGLTIDLGPAVTLTRHATLFEGMDNGMYIAESEKPTLYCGDLSVGADGEGLECMLRIQLEDYLYGVVAYEMSDSFPIEALKAQAVAARTYALQRKWSSANRDYDVVDTTADQVFKGYDPEYGSVTAAVDATRGVVGLWNGRFATCYYTASNGGQTALASQVWGKTDSDGYLAMVDDPYDLENARSLQSDLTFTAQCEGSLKLKSMLTEALKPVMEEAGFSEDQWTFDAIAAIEPVDPRYEGSRMYENLAFDLRVRVTESALYTPAPTADVSASPAPTADMSVAPEPEKWVPWEETRRVKLSVYDDIKDGLSMGLNGLDCELISVETEDGADGAPVAFRLVMRRFGHGVGMSQRGAQQMAGAHGMTWTDILEFYYPGMSFERMAWPEAPLTFLEDAEDPVGLSRPKPTPLPTPGPLPELKSGERYGTVNATTLNVREQPTTGSRIVDMLSQGRRVVASGQTDEDGWVAIHTAEIEGFVKEEYLVFDK